MAPLNIIIVGASIAGPAAAIGLARNGHNITLLERSTNGQEVGYAFRITANSDRCLRHLGIDTIAGGACAANTNRIYSSTGTLITETKENTDSEKAAQATSVFASRPALAKQLMDAALATGYVTLRTGAKVTSVDIEQTTVTLAGGETLKADLIIGADGVQSAIRPHIVDSALHHPKPSSVNVVRFMIPTAAARADPLLSTIVTDDAAMFTWAANATRILVYPVEYGNLLNVTMAHPAHLSDSDRKKDSDNSATTSAYNQKASFETVRAIHEGWDPRALRLIDLADRDGFRIWKLMDMDELPTCSRNRTVLVGDACHPVLPTGFSGASMAIEDAVTLGILVHEGVERGELGGLLRLYEEVRNPRVGRVRDEARKRIGGNPSKEEMESYRAFLQDHDAVRYAKEKLREYRGV